MPGGFAVDEDEDDDDDDVGISSTDSLNLTSFSVATSGLGGVGLAFGAFAAKTVLHLLS